MKKLFVSLLCAGMCVCACENGGENPLLSNWDAPYGIPPFDKIEPAHYMPAYKVAMEQLRSEIDSIVNNPEEPTFENTIVAYDNSGKLLSRISAVFSSDNGVNSNEQLRTISKELSPLLSNLFSDISMNEGLFKRIKSVYDRRDSLGLEPDQYRLVTLVYKDFQRSGAELPEERKAELKEVDAEIAKQQLLFGQNLLQQTAEYRLIVENEEDLKGLTDAQIADAAARAKAAGMEGKWIFGLDNPSVMPFLANADNRKLREEILTAYLNRANHDDEYDNKDVIKKLVELRLKKAQIMGYESCAAYMLDDRMAKTPEAVYDLLDRIWEPAIAAAKNEARLMEELIAEEKSGIDLEAWDWRYYSQKAMAKKYNIDESQVAPYFKLENVREGIFYVANRLYGLTFKQLENVPLPNEEAVAFEVFDRDSSQMGVVFFDMFARPGEKRGGAWCGTFRGSYYEDGKKVLPLVTIVANFARPMDGEPALLTMDEVATYFHEFGHGIDNLMKNVRYQGLRGYPRDFVEIHSQLNEHWAFEPQVLGVYAKHYKTGETIPMDIVEKLKEASKFGQGFATVEYLAASYLDMDFHSLKQIPEDLDVEAFEAKVLENRGLIRQIPPRYRSTYFNHTFGGGYTAGYYSYIWAEVLDADAYDAYKETGDIFNHEVAERYRKEILEKAGSEEAMQLYLNFRGKEPDIEPLLANRGLN